MPQIHIRLTQSITKIKDRHVASENACQQPDLFFVCFWGEKRYSGCLMLSLKAMLIHEQPVFLHSCEW